MGCRTGSIALGTSAVLVAVLTTACEDDGDGTGSTETSPMSTTAPTGSATAETTAGSQTMGTEASTGTGADSTGDSTTGLPVFPIELSNDGWVDGGDAFFQGGFVATECWASVYEAPPDTYPFVIDAVIMVVGGMDEGMADFSLAIWSVDATNMPDAELASATISVSGIDAGLDAFNLGLAGIESPLYEEGNFALAVCLESHDGFPAIAADGDGQVDYPDRNWIRLADGTWVQSSTFGVSGDWIMRAVVLPTG